MARIGTFDANGQITLWDVESAEKVKSLRTQRGEIRSVALSNDGNHIYSASADRTIYHFDITEDKVVQRCLT